MYPLLLKIIKYLFFVSDGQGGHRFSENLKEHIENIRIWKSFKKDYLVI